MGYVEILDRFNNKCPSVNNKIIYYNNARRKLTDEEKIRFFDEIQEDYIALMLIDRYESDNRPLVDKYMAHIDEYIHNVRNVIEVEKSWMCLLLLLKNMNDEELAGYTVDIFSKENTKREGASDLLYHYGVQIGATYRKLLELSKDFGWEKDYFKVMSAIARVRISRSFCEEIEGGLKELYFSGDYNRGEFNEYFDALILWKFYGPATYLLERIAGRDLRENIADWSLEEAKKRLLAIPSPRIVRFAKNYIMQRDPSYTTAQWIEDVSTIQKSNQDILKWINYYSTVMDIHDQVTSGTITEEEFYANEHNYGKNEIYINEKDNYITDFLVMWVKTLSTVMMKGWDVKRFLDEVKKINYFDYSRNDLLARYMNYDGIRNNIDLYETYNYIKATDMPYRADIYMNTHIRLVYPLYDLVAMLFNERRFIYFSQNYTLKGVAEYVNTRWAQSARDRMYIRPIGIYVDVTYPKAVELYKETGDKAVFRKFIRNDEDWYRRDSKNAELIRYNDEVTFRINAFKSENLFADRIELCDKDTYKEEENKRENYAFVVLEWLELIRKRKQFITWNVAQENYIVHNINSQENREKIALSILKTIESLLDNEQQLWAFVNAVVREKPYEDCNEFKAIRYEQHNDFLIRGDEFHREVKGIGDAIFASSISKELKLTIYTGTALKKYYLLEDVMGYCFDGELWSSVQAGIALPVKYSKTEGGVDLYSTYYFNFVYKSRYNVVINPTVPVSSQIVMCRITGKDDAKKLIMATPVELREEKAPDKIIRHLYDIKHNIKLRDTIKKQLRAYTDIVMNTKDAYRFSKEISSAFYEAKYQLDACFTIMETLEEVNPLIYKNYDYTELDQMYANVNDKIRERIEDSYNHLVNNYKQKGEMRYQIICKLYFESSIRYIVPYSRFLKDIAAGNEAVIDKHCRMNYKNFIK